MNKTLLLATVSFLALNSTSPVFAAKSESKMKECAKKTGHAIMWGPKKVASGFSACCKKVTGK